MSGGNHFCPKCGYNSEPDPVVEVYGWKLDPRAMTAKAGGRYVHFTASEFQMLYALLAASGGVVTRQVIRERAGTDADGNVLDVWACRIRKKIAGTGVMLKAVHGTGFRAIEQQAA